MGKISLNLSLLLKTSLSLCIPRCLTLCILLSLGSCASKSGNPLVFNYAYVTSGSSVGNVYLCSFNTSTGKLGCALNNGGVSSWLPMNVAFNTSAGTPYAYVVHYGTYPAYGDGTIYQCSLTSTGAFTSCVASNGGISGWYPNYISFHAFNGVTYAYVADDLDNMYQCSVLSTGALSGCAVNNGGAAWEPVSITFNVSSGVTYAYVAEIATGGIYKCSVNASTGALRACVLSNGGVSSWSPAQVVFQTSGGTTYAYVVANDIYQCSVNTSTGALSNCTISDGGISGLQANGIAFYSNSNGVTYAYVGGSQDGHLYQCSVLNTGALSACVIASTGVSSWLPNKTTFYP